MAVIIYMGAVLSMLYYCGVTQVCAGKTAWLMQRTMGTTAIETLGVASNIFLNGVPVFLIPLFSSFSMYRIRLYGSWLVYGPKTRSSW